MTERQWTTQEAAWAGQFGSDYIARNRRGELLAAKTAFFAKILAPTENIGSVLELGANIGLNLTAIARLLPDASLIAVEINPEAYAELSKLPKVTAHLGSLIDFTTSQLFDLTYTAGVLIHLDPDLLPRAYDQLHAFSRRYVAIAEYYNPTPVEVAYRGRQGLLYKRDFAGEFMDRFDDLRLVDYGFVWRRDPQFPADDLTWFLFEKRR